MSVYSIGDMARAGGLSVRMLRHYDEIGLLRPARTDSRTGYRSYEPKQLDRLHRILALKDLGFSLAQVRLIVDDDVSAEELRGMLRLRQMELTNEIADTELRLRRVELHIHSIDQESVMSNTDIIVKHIDEVLVAVVSAMADDFGPDSIGPVLQPLYPQLFERVAETGFGPQPRPSPSTRTGRQATASSYTQQCPSRPLIGVRPCTASRCVRSPPSSRRSRSCIGVRWRRSRPPTQR